MSEICARENCAISMGGLTKVFGEQTVLHNLNFDISKGKITTILGFSGAGKSTLLKHILGLLNSLPVISKFLGKI